MFYLNKIYIHSKVLCTSQHNRKLIKSSQIICFQNILEVSVLRMNTSSLFLAASSFFNWGNISATLSWGIIPGIVSEILMVFFCIISPFGDVTGVEWRLCETFFAISSPSFKIKSQIAKQLLFAIMINVIKT